MQFLNPRTAFAFKKIFGSAESKDILLSFLNAILNLKVPYQIVDFTIIDPYQAPKIAGLKHSYLDVKAEDQSGKFYIIEMQVLNVDLHMDVFSRAVQEHSAESFEKRILYNACKGYANQISKGEDYHLLSDVIAITVTNFVMFPQRKSVISKYKLRADDGDIYSDDLELVFAELPKFMQTETQLATIIDKWLFFLKHADDLTLIPDSLSSVPEIKHAFDIVNRASWTTKELEEQERYEITIQDQRGAISLAEKKAEAKGRAKGKAEGIEQERLAQQQQQRQEKIDSAKKMHKKGFSISDISEFTSLTEADLNHLLA